MTNSYPVCKALLSVPALVHRVSRGCKTKAIRPRASFFSRGERLLLGQSANAHVVIGPRASSVAERSQSGNCFKWSAKRSASASSVNVAFAQPPVGYTPVLQIQRFLK